MNDTPVTLNLPDSQTFIWIVNFAISEKGGKTVAISEISDCTDEKNIKVARATRCLSQNPKKRKEEIHSFLELVGREMHRLTFQ